MQADQQHDGFIEACIMPETVGQRELRITKARLVNEQRERTANHVSKLREQARNRSTDVETKATQCTDRTPCVVACMFCFWLIVANVLLLQWLYITGRLNL